MQCDRRLIAGVVDAISQGEFAAEHRIDPTRLALVGHSMGGFAALISGAELVAEMVANADRFDTTRAAPALARKRLLLIAGELDQVASITQNHLPMVEALERAGAASLQTGVVPGADHSFSGQRIALARQITAWLVETCAVAN